MRWIGLGALIVMFVGCMHAHRVTPVASSEVANSITFPDWSKDVTMTIEGPQLKALQIALEDFRPLGRDLPKDADELTRCLLRVDTFDVWLRRGEKMTFIYFNPREDQRCGLQPLRGDVSAAYAISDDGVILKRE